MEGYTLVGTDLESHNPNEIVIGIKDIAVIKIDKVGVYYNDVLIEENDQAYSKAMGRLANLWKTKETK